jgi:hypothetical protein
MTYLWTEGESIVVSRTLDDVPEAFTWRARTHAVQGVAKRWRVDVDWWRRRIWREYYKLYTRSGLLVIVYQDLVTGEWFLQRLFD